MNYNDIPKLLNCPFCGSDAELDTNYGFRHYATGKLLNGIVVTCVKCPANLQMCKEDFPGLTPKIVVELWNQRTDLVEQQQNDMPDKVFLNTQDYTMLMDENRVLKDKIATLQQQNEQLKASNEKVS